MRRIEGHATHFGRLTRALAVILVAAGVGATSVGLNSGGQTTPGSAHDGPILLGIGALT